MTSVHPLKQQDHPEWSPNLAKDKVSTVDSGSGSGRMMTSAMAAPSYHTNGPIKQLSQQEQQEQQQEEQLYKKFMWTRRPEEWGDKKPAGMPKTPGFDLSDDDFVGNPYPIDGRDLPTAAYGTRTGYAKKPVGILKKRVSYSSDEESEGSRPYPGDFVSMSATNNGAAEEEVAAGTGKAQYLSGTKDATAGALLGGSSGNGGYASEDEESDDYPISPKFVKGGQTDSERRKSRKVQAKAAVKSAGGGAAGYPSPTRDATGNTDDGEDHPLVPTATGAGARVHFQVGANSLKGTQKSPATPSAGTEGGVSFELGTDRPGDPMLDEDTLELGGTDDTVAAASNGLTGAVISFSTSAVPNVDPRFATPHSATGGRSPFFHATRNRTPRSAREIKEISSRHSARKDRFHKKMEQSAQRMNQRYVEQNAAVKKSEEETTQKVEENETLLMQQYMAADAQQDKLLDEELYAARDEV